MNYFTFEHNLQSISAPSTEEKKIEHPEQRAAATMRASRTPLPQPHPVHGGPRLGGEGVDLALGYLVVELLEGLDAARRRRRRQFLGALVALGYLQGALGRRLGCLFLGLVRVVGADGLDGLVDGLDVDDAHAVDGAAVLVAVRVDRLVDRYSVVADDLQLVGENVADKMGMIFFLLLMERSCGIGWD